MKTKIVTTSPRHEEFRKDLIGVLRKYSDLPAIDMLCVASAFVGQLVALQNQFEYTPEQVMAMVSKNIEIGNREAINQIFRGEAGNA